MMKNWIADYRAKVTTAAKAIRCITDGSCVVMSECAGVPRLLVKELARKKDRFHNVSIYHMLTLGEGECFQPECRGHFRHLTNFIGANSRKAMEDGQVDFFPAFFKDIPAMLGKEIPCDVAVVTATPPDQNGFCSLGLSCDYAREAVRKARYVIVETNEFLPYTHGDTRIHVSQMTHIIPCSYFPPELQRSEITKVETAIGKYCATLIEDGATLQLGIGSIPDAVLLALKDMRHLGIHSEMFSDGVVDLVEAGVIDGSRKTLHKGKMIATFLMGTRRLYDFVDQNRAVELHPVDYVNDPYVIGKNDRMVSINSCIEIDLTGQVVAETIGSRQFSGTGGQVDFIRGAARSKGGISILAMPSTAARGKKSRIVPFLLPGTAVTTSRNDVDFVVTEFGIARLKGRTLRQRAESLIKIAHPDFREYLITHYEKVLHSEK